MKTKLQLTDTLQDMVIKMAEGNPGAMNVLMQILRDGAAIDPDNIMGGVGIILSLDTLNLYGSKIWMLYKDACDCNLSQMVAVLRGHQLGFLSSEQLRHAVDNRGVGISVPDVCGLVCARLPAFKLSMEPSTH